MTAPAPTVRDRILDALANNLRSMTVAGGYTWDVKPSSVRRDEENILIAPAADLPIFLVQSTERGAFSFEPANQLKETYYAAITARVDVMAGDGGYPHAEKSRAQENLIGDIERALAIDNSLGGLPISDVRPEKAVPLQSPWPGLMVVVIVPVLIWVHRSFGQP
jgi:hypothetical protein